MSGALLGLGLITFGVTEAILVFGKGGFDGFAVFLGYP